MSFTDSLTMAGRGRGVAARLPGVHLAREYRRPWLRADVLAGVTVWALLVPQALAYAQVARLDAVVGLYAVIGATIGYLCSAAYGR